ncbi:ABC-F family ATP-binding cassette domain-containing protein [Proteiniborus sp. MB09-C3]|uniref:ABC-F family ATP-binding cassette domain-containing protein n=1 Tax=Proteiniborus sp. MB09-C3 TaxID=3050072 RepID=UPI00255291DC|nr:ABC-F family ATP-binding cassette domain-containing protein [Proteiniborus sp. MB09-C3]WIV12782.1 ABC-F family ATP-binding cassette domain-containing protein [Proteiniborus sp. MB09-C3]
MSILTVEKLNFGFGDKTILNNVSFRLLKGDHAGLVGLNGAGKTTFLDILTGKLIPDDGKLYLSSSINIGYLDQHSQLEDGYSIKESLKQAFAELYQAEERMLHIANDLAKADKNESELLLKEYGELQDILQSSDFYRIDGLIDNVAAGIGLIELGMDTHVDKLSGGQRTKVKLATLLLKSPDVLLLDEPTNYLDKEHIEWLANYLTSYSNSFIVISHDIAFLNRITNVIYHIEYGKMKRYPGNYDAFLKLKDDETKRYIDMYNKQQKEIARMEDFINKNIAGAATSKRAKSRRKQLGKIERLEKPNKLPRPRYTFLSSRLSGELVFRCSHLSIGYNYPLIKDLKLKLNRGQKIAITGCNGIGKSTLLKTIIGDISPLGGNIEIGDFLYPAYFEQETKISSNTAIEEIQHKYPEKSQKEIRNALARCGLKQEQVFQKMSSLSGGEQSKVRLCKLMMTPSNWLLLDEPTNHLDIDAKEALKEALIEYGGTIILVCHEKEFYEDWVTDIWNMEELASRQ